MADDDGIFLIDADTDERAAYYYGAGWRCIDTLPNTGVVECLGPLGMIKLID